MEKGNGTEIGKETTILFSIIVCILLMLLLVHFLQETARILEPNNSK